MSQITRTCASLSLFTAVLLGWACSSTCAADPQPPASNHLAKAANPWLRGQASSPVDWSIWSPEAFDRARRENKPVFVMIGYPACPGFRAMQRRILAAPQVAQFLNTRFVNILVDREERPELNDIYLVALETYFEATGSSQKGGWPISMFLTPEGKPLGGGTYFSLDESPERAGIITVLKRISSGWEAHRDDMLRTAEELTRGTRKNLQLTPPPSTEESPDWTQDLVSSLLPDLWQDYDVESFGFGTAPGFSAKFPLPARLLAMQTLFAQSGQADDPRLLRTLDALLNGALCDQLGGGFHHHCHDAEWKLPAFEKTLTDNLQLAQAFTTAYRRTNLAKYRHAAEQAVAFVLQDLAAQDGGLYASLGDETPRGERNYYVWTREEIQETLTPEEFAICRRVYGINDSPNFGRYYTLRKVQPLSEIVAELNLTQEQGELRLEQARRKLLEARRQRTGPSRDEKILASANGLAVRCLTICGMGLNHPEYVRHAEKTALFLLTNLRDDRGRLRHALQNGELTSSSYLEDYAFTIDGLLTLYQATSQEKWLNAAQRLMEEQVGYFIDELHGGFFATSRDHEDLLLKYKPWQEGTLPSGNSVSLQNLIRLSALTSLPQWEQRAKATADALWPTVSKSPRLTANFLVAVRDLEEHLNSDHAYRLTKADGTRRIVTLAANKQPADGDVPPPRKVRPGPKHVAATVYFSTDRLPAGKQVPFVVRLKIKEPWHINANDPGNEFNVKTEVTLTSKSKTKLVKMSYPKGEKFQPEGINEPSLVYSGTVDFRGVLDVPAAAGGKPEELKLSVSFQCCNDRECLRPQTLELVQQVEVAPEGEPVKKINAPLFAPPAKRPAQ
ncbi:MAG: DUF255 domain-containing protein [Planctomycetales bacterium]